MTNGDQAALLKHFKIQHLSAFNCKPDIAECFFDTFVEQPLVLYFDQCEDKWVILTGANINIRKMIPPRVF